MKEKVIAVVIARAGSKRIIKKNVRNFNGKPLICWTLESALNSECVSEVLVSTDDLEVVEICKSYPEVKVILRPQELSGDHVSSDEVILHALEVNKSSSKYVAKLQPTSPLRTSNDIDQAFKVLIDAGASSIVSVGELPFPKEWILELGETRLLTDFIERGSFKIASQNFSQQYFLNGAIYIAKRDYFTEEMVFMGSGEVLAYVMPFMRSLDIDDERDFEMAELIAIGLKGRDGRNC